MGQEMVTVHPQYLVDEKRQRLAVVLPIEEWERVLEDLEELDDIRAYDEAKAGPQDSVSLERAIREIHQEREDSR